MEGIVKEIYDAQEKIFLIYAFNATGKTRLSVEYKNYTKALNGGNHAGVYYNAYSEDLFRWNNDEENDNQDIRLEIVYSSLNEHHANLNEDLVLKKLAPYKPKYKFFLLLLMNLTRKKALDRCLSSLKKMKSVLRLRYHAVKSVFLYGAFSSLYLRWKDGPTNRINISLSMIRCPVWMTKIFLSLLICYWNC